MSSAPASPLPQPPSNEKKPKSNKTRATTLKLPVIPAREDPFSTNTKPQQQPLPLPLPLLPSETTLALEDLEKLSPLGSGSSGRVYKARHTPTGAIYALKVIQEKQDLQVRLQIKREMEILRRARNPHIVRCHAIFDHGSQISFLLEYMDAGTLAHLLHTRRTLPEPFLSHVARHVLNGLLYLHHNKIVHRDIKPSNLLLNHRNQVKIADFGVSKLLANTLAQCNSYVGTCAYMSPERFDPETYGGEYDGCSADIWSLGLSLLECAIGRFPCLSPGQKLDWPTLMVAICFGEPPAPPLDSSPEFQGFISSCLQKNARQRPSALRLLSHPFVTKYSDVESNLSPLLESLCL